jgi:phosphatidylethanolamine-binding protein (PEBP) family uncharacterized protein
VVGVTLATTGCGGATTTDSREAPKVASKRGPVEHLPSLAQGAESPAIARTVAHPIASRYTCNGVDVSPPLRWSEPRRGTAEIAITVVDTKPVHNKLVFQWAVLGINPHLHELSTGRLPSGTTIGRNATGHIGYNICPPLGPAHQYLLSIYTLPHRIDARSGFNEAVLRERLVHNATSEYFLFFTYKRH